MTKHNYLPTIFTEVPPKTELERIATAWVGTDTLTPLEKKLVIHMLEYILEQAKKKLGEPAKEDFLKLFNGVTSIDFYGVNLQLIDYSKSATLKDPSYNYSINIKSLEDDIEYAEYQLKLKREELKLRKTIEINDGTAKKLDADIFPEPLKDNFKLKVTLRK